MNKRNASKILKEGSYLLNQIIQLKTVEINGSTVQNQFLVEKFGATKVFYSKDETNAWYEVWASLKNVKTNELHKMRLERLINLFPKGLKNR